MKNTTRFLAEFAGMFALILSILLYGQATDHSIPIAKIVMAGIIGALVGSGAIELLRYIFSRLPINKK